MRLSVVDEGNVRGDGVERDAVERQRGEAAVSAVRVGHRDLVAGSAVFVGDLEAGPARR